MTFLNIVLLAGAAAASIPILIHLFNRSRYRTVKWGAMHLLDTAVRTRKRRLQIEQLLLLLVRCAIIAVLALCMARPVFTGMSALVGAAKSSVVILLDNSYSMEYGGRANGNFIQARQAASGILEDLGRGSEAAVVLMGGTASALLDGPVSDLQKLNRELASIEAGHGRASVPQALETAAGLFSKMHHPHRELIVISDFQQVSWTEDEASARACAAELLSKLPLPPHLTLFPVGLEGRDNVSVESLEFSRLVFGIGQPVQIRATLRNHGERPYSDLRVYFRVDGRERGAVQISLAPQEKQQVLFQHTFESAGSHVVEVHAEADTLTADNSFLASIPVWDRVPALLINGDPSAEPLKGETDFLEIALQPFGKAKADLTDLIQGQVGRPEDLKPETLNQMRVVVLANVRQLTDPQLKALQEFVRNGGGLLVFPGNRINVDWYNRVLAAEDGLLPLPMVSLAGSLDAASPPASIIAQHYSHSALEMFNDPRNGNLSDAEIKLWYKTGERPASSVSVLARLNSGDPFLIEKKFGEGRVIQCVVPADADWSNLPTRPVYLPLMQRLVTYLASTVFPPRNVEVEKPLLAFFPKTDAGKSATVTDPAGRKHTVPIVSKGSRGLAEFRETARPGLYLMTGPGGTVIHFVASTSREESDLRLLSATGKEAVAKALGASLVTSQQEYRALDHQRRFGREIWKPLLGLVIALIFSEMLLQQWIARRK